MVPRQRSALTWNIRPLARNKEDTIMSLKNLFHKTNQASAASACGTACGTGDKKPAACGTACGAGDKKPTACGTACGAGDKKPTACGTACGAGDKK